MALVKIMAIASIFFSPLYAWKADDFLLTCENVVSHPEKDTQFMALKTEIKKQLKASWCSEEKIDLLMDLVYIVQPEVCVEIGAFTGSSILPVACALKHLGKGKIYAIDAWSNEEAIRHLALDDPNRGWWGTIDMNVVRNAFDHLIGHWGLKEVCTTIPTTSALALTSVPEIDFLHLDGNFSEKGSFEDVTKYLAKVKEGGYVLLSNVYHTVKNKQPKVKTFVYLFETCEFVGEADKDNTVLFRKL